MPWVKLDDAYFSNGKARESGPKGRCLHLASACYVAANLSDGKVPKHVIPMLLAQAAVPKSTVVLLVRLNLWHDQGDHYLLHDWHEYIRSKEEVLAEREAARLRKAKSRRESHRDVQRESRRESQGESQDSRPDPSRISVKPPTGYLRGAALTGTAGDVLKLILDAERKKSGPVRNPSAWEATVTDRLLSEHGERIQQCVEDFPTAPADVIAGHVLGQTNNLRYYPRRESA